MQPARDALRQRAVHARRKNGFEDATRTGRTEAKILSYDKFFHALDAILINFSENKNHCAVLIILRTAQFL